MRNCLLVPLAAFAATFALMPAAAQPPADQLKTTVDKAVAYLKKSQNEDGSWCARTRQNRGVTGIVVTGLIGTGTAPGDAPVAKGITYIETLVNKKDGHIAGNDAKAGLINYITSINVMALTAADKADKYKAVIGNAVEVPQGVPVGRGPRQEGRQRLLRRGRLRRRQVAAGPVEHAFFLDALKEAGVPKDDPAFKKALIFVSRCQNLKSEFNEEPWAEKINDGSFIYTGANGGENRRTDGDGTKTDMGGYGSMTYAGVKSMIYCGVGKDDPRMKKALEWIGKNYTLDANPGMPEANGQRGLYYYYHTLAKCVDALGEDTFTDAKGVKHDWRADLIAALAKRQKPDGSWVNENDRWMEGDPNLVTGYALMALSYCKKK